jgi:hypothetical protein
LPGPTIFCLLAVSNRTYRPILRINDVLIAAASSVNEVSGLERNDAEFSLIRWGYLDQLRRWQEPYG